jgi:hypothetical protein
MERKGSGRMWSSQLAMSSGQEGQGPLGSAGTCETCNRIFVLDSLQPGHTRCPDCHNLLRPTTREELRTKLRRDRPAPPSTPADDTEG